MGDSHTGSGMRYYPAKDEPKPKVSIYKNELGTLNTDRLLKIHRFLDEQQKKQLYELSEHISDFAEQECEDYKISLAVASRAMNQLQSSLKEKEKECAALKTQNSAMKVHFEAGKKITEHSLQKANEAKSAVETVDSEREMNAILTKELEELKAENERLRSLLKKLTIENCECEVCTEANKQIKANP